jgi:thiosulfate/3-mercaptopyruvate sulfurtransferase
MPFARPQYLVETDWLAQHLDDPDVRVLECTVYLHPDPASAS